MCTAGLNFPLELCADTFGARGVKGSKHNATSSEPLVLFDTNVLRSRRLEGPEVR